MKQILQNLRIGVTEIADVPRPAVRRGHLLIRTTRTLLSAGTERMLVEFGKAGWIDKARRQPDKVKMVLDKVRTDGFFPTVDAVLNKLDQPLPLGYCNVGVVMDVGAGVTGFSVGDRVASNGAHAEIVNVPANLCARIPPEVSDDAAAFTVIGAIALQGIRLVQPTLGEYVVVTGLGLIGLMTVQLLRAHGCKVLGLDFDPKKLSVARRLGAQTVDLSAGEDPVASATAFSRGRGVDAVLITASTNSNEPVSQAARMCRKRGRIVLVGVTGLELSRADFYEKELSFQVSCSYGPGRYDPGYEEGGNDYPIGFVRWTEQRNFEAVLDMLADKRIEAEPLITHRFSLERAQDAYEVVAASAPSLGILIEYPEARAGKTEQSVALPVAASNVKRDNAVALTFVGAGNYAGAMLIPAFKKAGAGLIAVASSRGVSSVHAGRKFGFVEATTDADSAISDNRVDAIVVATRHDSHAHFVEKTLRAGKHVFVEKPLALTHAELDEIDATYRLDPTRVLMVGFNRRFAPHIRQMHTLLRGVRDPKVFVVTVNAGAIPADHWTQKADSGGGRILGEACHFIDLLRHLAGAPITGFEARSIAKTAGTITDDKATIVLQFADGSMGTILYLANGHKSFPKERLEIFAANRVLQLENFRRINAYGWPGASSKKLWRQDKGQFACAAAFVNAVRSGGPSPTPYDELMEVSRVTIDIASALRD